MTKTEGVIQYRLDHVPGPLPAGLALQPLFDWFARCRRHALIGRDPGRYDGLAYGNISLRAPTGFVISGTQTGDRDSLAAADLAWVRAFDVTANRLWAGGPVRPSSEAMTHGQLYRALPDVNAVIHVHSPVIWRYARHLGLPVTAAAAGYGTPAMAAEVERLARRPDASRRGVLAMGGHDDGIIAFGTSLDEAGERLLATLTAAEALAATTPD